MRKTILIISEKNDQSTNYVIDWLDYNNIRWQRVNIETPIQSLLIRLHADICVEILNNAQKINLYRNCNYTIWYRRGAFSVKSSRRFKEKYFEREKLKYLKKEWNTVLVLLDYYFREELSTIGSYTQEIFDNKLIDLLLAKKAGLNIPDTNILSSKEDLYKFSKKYKLITKSLKNDLDINTNQTHCGGTGTNSIDNGLISSLSDYFFPSLVQEKIKKAYELRIFFIANTFFAMAIFDVSTNKNDIADYRNLEDNNKRYIPYELPIHIREKLLRFIRIKDIDTGSIDILVSEDNKYFFLEVNPAGQFDWLSANCNYFLDKEIARILTDL